jgi:hypothetical protein
MPFLVAAQRNGGILHLTVNRFNSTIPCEAPTMIVPRPLVLTIV